MDNVIWVDENDTELGIISRERAHREGLLHRIVVTYLTRPNGDILGQERMSGRLDHSSAGHVDPGESYLAAAKRELNEELGITPENFNEVGKTTSDDIEPEENGCRVRHMFTIFTCQAEPGRLAPDEVKSVFWANPEKVKAEMQHDPGNERYTGWFKASLQFFLHSKSVS